MGARTVDRDVARMLRQGCDHHQQGKFVEAARCYRKVLTVAPENADALYLMGTLHFQRQDLDSAVRFLRKALENSPRHVDALNNLGLALQAKRDLAEAQECFEQVLKIQPTNAQAIFNLANVLRDFGKLDHAAKLYHNLVDQMPGFSAAYENLALVYRAQGDLQKALDCAEQALEWDPQRAGGHNTRGAILQSMDRTDEAIASFKEAVRLVPDFPEAHFNAGSLLLQRNEFAEAASHLAQNVRLRPQHAEGYFHLGLALHQLGQDEQASTCFELATKLRPQWPEAHNNRGTSLSRLNKWDEAIDCYRQVVELQPDHPLGWVNLATSLEQQSRFPEAKQAYNQATARSPDDDLLKLRADTLCDLVFDSDEQIEEYRTQLAERLQHYAEKAITGDLARFVAAGVRPSFNLQFHGRNELGLRKTFASIFAHNFSTQPLEVRGGRPKVGFVVTPGHHYAFCRSIGGMFALFSDAIDPVIICSEADAQRIQVALPDCRLNFAYLPAEATLAAQAIQAGDFDVLYYFEVATGILNYFLPFCRLAPIQCASWGIQVTSGIPNVDYYISSRLIETEHAQERYSEKLLLLDTMLSYQAPAVRPMSVRDRGHFGLSADRTLYLCVQHLGKFHPNFDNILSEILQADPRGEIVLTDGRMPWVAQRLRERFQRHMGDVSDRIRFLPQQSGDDYYSLLINGDVLLDPSPFGGVNTTYDALSFGKPVVTLPTDDNRGRYTRGCYQALGIMDCVANTRREYVDLAVSIANDPQRRDALQERILANHSRIFRCVESARELESLFLQLVENHSKT